MSLTTCQLSLGLLRKWNQNDAAAFRQAWEALAPALTPNTSSLDRLGWEPGEEIPYIVIALADNWVNSGNTEQGQAWVYEARVDQPPGPRRARLARLNTSQENKPMLRNYRGLAIYRGPDKFLNLLRTVAHKRRQYDAPRWAELELRIGRESLEGLVEKGSEPGAIERGFTEVEERLSGNDRPSSGVRTRDRAADLGALARAADDRLAASLSRRRTGSVAWRFLIVTRLFLAYVVEACQDDPANVPLHYGWPGLFVKWLGAQAGVELTQHLPQASMDVLVRQLDHLAETAAGRPQSELAQSESLDPRSDECLAELVEHLNEQRRADSLVRPHDAREAGRRAEQHRQRRVNLAVLLGRSMTDSPAIRMGLFPNQLESLGEARIAEAARRLDQHRWAELAADLHPVSGAHRWEHLAAKLEDPGWRTLTWPQSTDNMDLDLWTMLAVPRSLEAGCAEEDSEAPSSPLPSLYSLWHDACYALLAHNTRDALDRAKSNIEHDGDLDHFYTFINRFPLDRSAGNDDGEDGEATLCDRVRQTFADFLDGNVVPVAAAQFRAHMHDCSACFWVFSDYIDDRVAWGYRPQSAVAALRERVRALGWRQLNLRIGEFVPDLNDIVDQLREALARLSQTRGLIPTGREVEAEDRTEHFSGFGLQPGNEIAVHVLDPAGRPTGTRGTARVIAVRCDPQGREAGVTLQAEGLPDTAKVLLAQAEAAGVRYSLAAELLDGEATVTVSDLPEEFGDLHIETWYAVEGNPETPISRGT
jgi:hypothetical protein